MESTQRHKRLLRCKVNQAKRKARTKMEVEGVSPEEIERRLEEVVREVEEKDRLERERNPVDPADYKPRENARKPWKRTKVTAPQTSELESEAAVPPQMLPFHSSSLLSGAPDLDSSLSAHETSTHFEAVELNETRVEDVNIQEFSENIPESSALDDYDDDSNEPIEAGYFSEPPSPNDCHQPVSSLDPFEDTLHLTSEHVSPIASHTQDKICEDDPEGNQILEENNPVAIPHLDVVSSTCEFSEVIPTTIEKEQIREEEAPPSPSSLSSPLPTAIENEKVEEVDRVICDECGKLLRPMSVKFHKFTYHNPNRTDYKCPKCNETLATARSLWDHYLNFHEETLNSEQGERPFIKLKRGPSRSTVPNEKQQETKNPNSSKIDPFICEHCGNKYTQKAQMEAHVRRVHFNQRFICDVCGKEEQTGGKLWKHKIANHPEIEAPAPEGMVVCEYCSKPVLRSYQFHVKKYHPEKNDEFEKKQSILKVKKVYSITKRRKVKLSDVIRSKKIKCPECDQQIRADCIKRHLRNVHGHGTNSFPCRQCNKVFKENYYLNEHIRNIHTLNSFDRKVEKMELIKEKKVDGELIYSCSVCDERIFRKKDMGGHLLTSHFDLYEQLKQPADDPELEERRVVHEKKTPKTPTRKKVKMTGNNEPVNCDQCGKSLHSKALKRHKHLMHNQSGESNKCPKCEVCFTSPKTLWNHYHYICSIEETVTSLEELESRRLLERVKFGKPKAPIGKEEEEKGCRDGLFECEYTGLDLSPCQHCQKEFKTNSELNVHIRTKHTFESFERKVETMKLIKQTPTNNGRHSHSCSLCDANLFSRKDMGAHLLSAHFEVYEQLKKTEYEDLWKCGECSEPFDTEQLFSSHVQRSHPSTTVYCSQLGCHKLFTSQHCLTDHHRKQHPHINDRNPLLNVDVEAPVPLPGFKCSRCDAKFLQKPKLVEHVSSEHPGNYWPCPHCDLFGYSEHVLKNHIPKCDKNPDKQVLVIKFEKNAKKKCSKTRISKKKRLREESETEEETETDDDDDWKRSRSPVGMGTRRSSHIKIKRDKKSGQKLKEKVAQGSLDDDKLKMEVKVRVERLTKEQIQFHTSWKYR